jgi:hypothetical protein
VTKLDWSKAKAKPAPKSFDYRSAGIGRSPRQKALDAYVARHGLACFKCGTRKAEWAKTGRSKRGPWAICAKCVRG